MLSFLFGLLAFPPIDVTDPAIVPHQVFAFVRDVRGDGRDPIYDRKHLEVALEDRMHLGPVDDRTALRMIVHLLQRDRGPQYILGSFSRPGWSRPSMRTW